MKRNLLIINESKAIRYLLQNVFYKKFQVIAATNAYAAMYWLSNNDVPELIIIDPKLSDAQDWELLEYLSSSQVYKDVPLIVLSEQCRNEEILNKCSTLQIQHFFQQPFNPVELIEHVENIITSKKQPMLQIRT